MNLVLTPKKLSGTLVVPSSKSAGHRELICAALADGKSLVKNMTSSEDLDATCRVLREFGAQIETKRQVDNRLTIIVTGGLKPQAEKLTAYCGESGSTVRFLIPVGLLTGKEITYIGRGRLPDRPLDPFLNIFDNKKIAYTKGKDSLPLTVKGRLKGGIYELPGNVSSQFFTGLLMALPLLPDDSVLQSTTVVESESYINITLDCLRRHGIYVEKERDGLYLIRGRQAYRTGEYPVEGDFSQAAFWLVGGIIGQTLELTGLSGNSTQGDREIVSFIESMRGRIERSGSVLRAVPSRTTGLTIDVKDCPDLVPALAVLGTFSQGITRIVNGSRVRLKECDRLHAMAQELNSIGGKVRETGDGLIIEGVSSLTGGRVQAWNDHRIAMALAMASQRCTGKLTIEGVECVRKSYPSFWQDFAHVGGIAVEETV